MQTIEEYQRYTRQLEGEVKKWHDAFDASEEVNRQLAKQLKPMQQDIIRLNNENKELKESNTRLAIKNKILQKSHDATTKMLQELLDQFNENIIAIDKTKKEQ